MSTIHAVLKQYWGFDSFRSLQEEIVQSVLDGKDTLALLPTGGGKSICFQVPAMAKDGICVVVSPLIALMHDQVENLVKRGIKAIAITSAMSRREIDIALDNCIYGPVKFLYLSPERLQSELVQIRIRKMKVNLFAVDEAHCISQWGYDFRPPYLQIAVLRELHPKVPVLALTATATPVVVKDIQVKLAFRRPNVIQKSFSRANLAYHVRNADNKYDRLLKVANGAQGSGVVYVRNRKKTIDIARFLHEQGISATFYHAGLDAAQRQQRQKLWIDGQIRVIVATNAFGMGIDKPDVRFVVHMDLPDSPEAYFQEAGRAGRDEQKAFAVALWNNNDISELERNFERSFPSLEEIRQTYQAISNYYEIPVGSGEGQTYILDQHLLCERYKLDPLTVFNSIRFLEREGYFAVSDAVYQPSRLHVPAKKEDLYRFQVANPMYDEFIKLLLRSYSGLFEQFAKFSETQLAQRASVTKDEVIRRLKELEKHKLITYIPATDRPQMTFLGPRADAKTLHISPEHLAERKRITGERVQAMITYVKSTHRCRSRQLLAYFGETDTNDCGICDVCLERKKVVLQMNDDELADHLLRLAATEALSLQELVAKSGVEPEERVVEMIRWMMENGIIQYDSEQKIMPLS
ncbi:MAG: ATP-dependent DNA helicase RecQ [Bacteroidetes bacterium]|nr:MAG: ATP-dependent DNA helicase RecQ [Bacteroidota bacterium]